MMDNIAEFWLEKFKNDLELKGVSTEPKRLFAVKISNLIKKVIWLIKFVFIGQTDLNVDQIEDHI